MRPRHIGLVVLPVMSNTVSARSRRAAESIAVQTTPPTNTPTFWPMTRLGDTGVLNASYEHSWRSLCWGSVLG